MATSSIKIVRPKQLTESESLTSFEDWRNNLEFFLSQDKDVSKYLKSSVTWSKKSAGTDHRGFASADEAVALSQFLGIIASLSPPLLHDEITDDCESLTDIYRVLRSYYQFAPSESTFIQFTYIKREIIDGKLERPLHLYLRLRQFLRDNLLLSSGKIQHDGKVPTTSETFSPTVERLIVLRWLEILNPALPNHVLHVFSHQLQSKSLKDLYPQIIDQVKYLLRKLENKDEIDAQYARFTNKKGNSTNFNRFRPSTDRRKTFAKEEDSNKGFTKNF